MLFTGAQNLLSNAALPVLTSFVPAAQAAAKVTTSLMQAAVNVPKIPVKTDAAGFFDTLTQGINNVLRPVPPAPAPAATSTTATNSFNLGKVVNGLADALIGSRNPVTGEFQSGLISDVLTSKVTPSVIDPISVARTSVPSSVGTIPGLATSSQPQGLYNVVYPAAPQSPPVYPSGGGSTTITLTNPPAPQQSSGGILGGSALLWILLALVAALLLLRDRQ